VTAQKNAFSTGIALEISDAGCCFISSISDAAAKTEANELAATSNAQH
jgi:hypothetical protein